MHKLADLLWVDDQYDEGSKGLAHSFGDRYLCHHNAFFGIVRNLYLHLGFRFESENCEAFRNYIAAPLFVLNDLVEQGAVPYLDNASVLRAAVRRNKNLELSDWLLGTLVNHNVVLHESCHLISDRILEQKPTSLSSRDDKVQFVVRAIACEAFANTIERMAYSLAASPTHALFLRLNSYVHIPPHKRSVLADCTKLYGYDSLLRLGFLVMVYLNTHADPPSDTILNGYIDLVFTGKEISTTDRAILGVTARIAFVLSRSFQKNTSTFYFGLFGCEQEYVDLGIRSLCNDDLTALGITDAMERLASIVVISQS